MSDPLYAIHHDQGPGVGPGRVVPAAEDRRGDELARLAAERDRWRLAFDREAAERQHLRRAVDRLEAEAFALADQMESVRADRDRLRYERDAAETLLSRISARMQALPGFRPEGRD